MKDFERKTGEYIRHHDLLPAGARVVVAVSGGADSVALLEVLQKLGYDCVGAHCNFHLRGEESNRDMRHVVGVAKRAGVNLYVKDFDIARRTSSTGESLEMACRAVRYAWFEELLDKERARAIAVGHHREDQAETFILNAVRGTGLAGLAGMSPRNGNVIRPLLWTSRSEIERYLAEAGAEYVTDSSNATNDYKRNRVRHIALPALEEALEGAVDGILTTMGHASANRDLYDFAVRRLAELYVDRASGTIDVEALKADVPERVRPTLLFEMIRERGFNATHAKNMLEAEGSAEFTGRGATAVLSRGKVTFRTTGTEDTTGETAVSLRHDIVEPVEIVVTEHRVTSFKPERDARTAYFDAKVLEGEPRFALRRWRRGDRMRPYGMNGTKLISDLFADAKLSQREKEETWLLTRNGEILWAVGLRASGLYAVTPKTRRFIRLELRRK